MTANGPDTLAAYYQSLALIEGKIVEQEEAVRLHRRDLGAACNLLVSYKVDRRDLHKLIAAKKKRPAKAAAGDPEMPANLRRS